MYLFMIEKAVFYARVSTTNKEQETSIESQIKMCTHYLQDHPEIQLAEPIDAYCEKISGKSDNRPKYRKMLNRIEQGDIRYIIIKDTKRISRAADVSAQLRNTLKRHNMKLIILSEGGRIKDINADENRMIYGFEALMAEELVFTQSRYGRLAHQQKCNEKRLNRNNVTFGYRWNTEQEEIEIEEEQAKIIQNIFEMYAIIGKTITDIQTYLSESGYSYSKVTIRKWLKQETYIGIFYLNQKGSELGVGIGGKTKRYTNPKEEWVRVDRPELRIISDELFFLTQKLLFKRKSLYEASANGVKQPRFEGTALFSGKIYCGECNKSYIHRYADRAKAKHIYIDSFRMKTTNPLVRCQNPYSRLYEDDLVSIYQRVRKSVFEGNRDSLVRLKDVIKSVIKKQTGAGESIADINRKIEKLSQKADDLTYSYISAPENMKERIQKLYNECESQIEELSSKKEELLQKSDNTEILLQRINAVDMMFETIVNAGSEDADAISRDEVKKLIHKIVVDRSGIIKLYFNQPLVATQKNDPAMEYKFLEFQADYSYRCKSRNGVSRKFQVEVYIEF